METMTLNNRKYRVTEELGVGPATASQLGIVRQCVIEGVKGSTLLLQVFANGTLRTINARGQRVTVYR
jgi:predicted regulator of Ras-like GTPase activity (Roadblock/LC7/MglB family)